MLAEADHIGSFTCEFGFGTVFRLFFFFFSILDTSLLKAQRIDQTRRFSEP